MGESGRVQFERMSHEPVKRQRANRQPTAVPRGGKASPTAADAPVARRLHRRSVARTTTVPRPPAGISLVACLLEATISICLMRYLRGTSPSLMQSLPQNTIRDMARGRTSMLHARRLEQISCAMFSASSATLRLSVSRIAATEDPPLDAFEKAPHSLAVVSSVEPVKTQP